MLLAQTLKYLPAQVLGPLSQFIAVIVWTHLLGASVFGAVAYIIAAQELSFSFGISWWSLFTLRYRRRFADERQARIYRATDNAVVLFSVAMQLAGSLVIVWMATGELAPLIVTTVAIYIISRSSLMHFGEWARSQEEILTYTLATLCGPLIGSVASVVAILVFGASIVSVLAAFGIVQVLTLLVVMARLKVGLSLTSIDFSLVKSALKYGLPLAIAGVLGWGTLNGIRVIVQQMADLAAVGLLSVGWGIGHRITAVAAMAVTAAAYPLAVKAAEEGDAEEGLVQISANAMLLFGLMAPVCVGVFLVTNTMVTLAIAEEFVSVTVIILPIAVLVGSLRNLRAHWADQAHLLMARTKILMVINFVEVVVSIAGCYIGYAQGGLLGAVLGVLVAVSIGFVLAFGHAMVALKMPVLWLDMSKIVLASAGMAIAVYLVPETGSVINLILRIGVGGLVYSAILYVLFGEIRELFHAKIRARSN